MGYCDNIPYELAVKLKAKGMPIETEGDNIWCPSFAEVADWFMSKDLYISVERFRRFNDGPLMYRGCACSLNITDREGVSRVYVHQPNICDKFTWNDLMVATIERGLELM